MALYNSWHDLRSREDAATASVAASAGDGSPGSQHVSESATARPALQRPV